MRNSLKNWAAAATLATAAGWSSSAIAQIDVGGAVDAAGDVGGNVGGDVGGSVDVGGSADVAPDVPSQPQTPPVEAPRPSDIPEVNTEDLTDGAIQEGDRAIQDTQEAIDDTTDRAQDSLDDTTDRAQDTLDDTTDRAEGALDDTLENAEGLADDAMREGEEAMQSFDELDADAQAELRTNAEFDDEINEQISSDLGLDIDANADTSEGLRVNNVTESSLAAQAGLRRGDVIVSLDGRNFNSHRGFNEYVWRHGYNRIPIVVIRGGQRQTIWWNQYPTGWNNYFVRSGRGYGYRDGYRGGNAQQGPYAGLGVLVVDGDSRQGGVFVQAVHENSPAAQAGVRPGDVILAMNGRRYGDATQFVQAIRQMDPNGQVQLAIMRENGQETQLTAQLSTRDRALGGNYTQEQLASQQEQDDRQRVLRPQYNGDGQQQPQTDDAAQQRIDELEQQVRELQQQLQERE